MVTTFPPSTHLLNQQFYGNRSVPKDHDSVPDWESCGEAVAVHTDEAGQELQPRPGLRLKKKETYI